jgi:hypothetical protein
VKVIARKARWQWHPKLGCWTIGNNQIVVKLERGGNEFEQPYPNLDPSIVLRELYAKQKSIAQIRRREEEWLMSDEYP